MTTCAGLTKVCLVEPRHQVLYFEVAQLLDTWHLEPALSEAFDLGIAAIAGDGNCEHLLLLVGEARGLELADESGADFTHVYSLILL